MSDFRVPRLHGDLPGIGGVLKEQPEDFVVDEIPAYELAGEGEHLFLRIEKRDVAAEELLRHVCRKLEVHDRDVGCAGLKDKRAVTRQWLSVPIAVRERLEQLETPAIRILEQGRHTNKLRTGHLRGNRFCILVRGADTSALGQASELCALLRDRGAPNSYGEQRFGVSDANVAEGLALLRAHGPASPDASPDATPDATPAPQSRGRRRRPNPRRRRFLLSAVQSALFNRYLTARMEAGNLCEILDGDVVQDVGSPGYRQSEDAEQDQQLFSEQKLLPAGPIFGGRMVVASDAAAELEQTVLEQAGLTLENFTSQRKHARGTRRPLLVWPTDLSVEAHPEGLEFTFELPAGSYATVIMREIMGT